MDLVPTPTEAGLIKTPKIRCAHDAQVDPKFLKPHPRNPNKHGPKQIELFISIICYTGWRRPITVSKRSGYVTKGHGALEAALTAGFIIVPVDYQDYEDENQELSDIVADNQLQRMSEMDHGKLTELLVELDNGVSDLQMTGIENSKLEEIFTSVPGYYDKPDEGLSVPHYEGAPTPDTKANFALEAERSGGPAEGQPYVDINHDPQRVASGHVRMIQLYFDQQTVSEFITIVDHFQKLLCIDNVTDTVMVIMRDAMQENSGDGATDPA